MAFIITCENCIGQRFKFIQRDGEILTKPAGKQVQGILALQQPDKGSDKLRLTFVDAANLGTGLIPHVVKKVNPIVAFLSALFVGPDPLCHFDFSKRELRDGTKSVKCVEWLTIIPPITYTILCYDFSTGEGRGYIFPDEENLKMFAVEAGITEMEVQDHDGKVLERKEI